MKPAFTDEVLALLVVLVPTVILTGAAVVAQLTRVGVRLSREVQASVDANTSVHRRLLRAETQVLGARVAQRRGVLEKIATAELKMAEDRE